MCGSAVIRTYRPIPAVMGDLVMAIESSDYARRGASANKLQIACLCIKFHQQISNFYSN